MFTVLILPANKVNISTSAYLPTIHLCTHVSSILFTTYLKLSVKAYSTFIFTNIWHNLTIPPNFSLSIHYTYHYSDLPFHHLWGTKSPRHPLLQSIMLSKKDTTISFLSAKVNKPTSRMMTVSVLPCTLRVVVYLTYKMIRSASFREIKYKLF